MRALPCAVLALGVAALACSRPGAESEVGRLQREREGLRDRLRGLLGEDARLVDAPTGSVLVGVPTSLVRSLVEQTVTGLFGEVTLRLRDLKVHKGGEVRVQTPLGRMLLGSYDLDLVLREVGGLLRPGVPELTFGGDRIGVALPVHLAQGSARATLRFRWEGRQIAGAVCGDFDVTRPVEGAAKPATYPVKGAFALTAEGSDVVLKPEFGQIKIRVEVEPSKQSWAFVDELIEQQGGLCRTAMEQARVASLARELVGRGFDVKLPRKLFRPLRLPAGLERSVSLKGRVTTLDVQPIGLSVTPLRLWYGANVKAFRSPAAR